MGREDSFEKSERVESRCRQKSKLKKRVTLLFSYNRGANSKDAMIL